MELHSERQQGSRFAQVRWCQERGAGFRIGLEFIAKPSVKEAVIGALEPR